MGLFSTNSLLWLIVAILLNSCSGIGKVDFEPLHAEIRSEVLAKDPYFAADVCKVNYAPEEIEQGYDLAKQYLVRLKKVNRSELNLTNRFLFDQVQYRLSLILKRKPFLFHHYSIVQNQGIHIGLIRQFKGKSLGSKKAIQTYLKELNEVGPALGFLIDGMEYSRQLGIVPPTFVLSKTISLCDSLAEVAVQENIFYKVFEDELNSIDFLDPESRSRFLGQCYEIVDESVTPGYKRLTAYLRQLEGTAFSVPGVWQFPKGIEYYGYCLKLYSGTDRSPDEFYEMGKLQYNSIDKAMNAVNQASSIELELKQIYNDSLSSFEKGFRLFEMQLTAQQAGVDPLNDKGFQFADKLATTKMMVDIGIHYKQWLREQAVNYTLKQLGIPKVDAEYLVDEVIARPGLHAADKIIHIELQELQGDYPVMQIIESLKPIKPKDLHGLRNWIKTENIELAS